MNHAKNQNKKSRKGESYLIQTQAKWDLERASLIGSCGELNCEILQNAGHFGTGLICPGLFHPNLGDGSFRPWKVGHFGQFSKRVISALGRIGQSESDNVCIIISVWMDRWAGVKFCEKIRWK